VIVDAHQHFWDPAQAAYPWMTDEVAAIRRRFGPDDLEPVLREHGVAGSVVVQARHALDETRWLLELAASTPFVLGVVGWVDLTGDVAQQLADLDGPLVGIRHQVHDEPDADWLRREDVQRGIGAVGEAGLVFDLLVRTRELAAAAETARRHPDVRFVLDHVAKCPQEPAERAGWERGVRDLAGLENVTCKLSGLVTEGDPGGTAARALTWFRPERCMFGSDWPVCLLAADYGETLALAGEDDAVLSGTAIATYGLTTNA
jgi:L-fuconolactonase